jgi:hypothetical protein
MLDVELQTYGGEVRYLAEGYHLNFGMKSIDTEEDAPDYNRKRSEDVAEFRFATLGDRLIDSDFRYTRRVTTDELSISTDLDYDDLILTNTLEYGNISGRSYISYYRVTGDYESDNFMIMENVDVTHSDTLQTFYDYNYSRYDTGGGDFTSNINYGKVGFRHQLYVSLRTRFYAEVSHTDDDAYRELYYAPNLSLAYTKEVPFGRVSAAYDGYWRKTESETKGSSGSRRVFAEPHVLQDGTRTFLDNINVILESVVVRDESGTLLVENFDYELRQSGSVTEIRRVNLPNNTLVLVDYAYLAPNDLDYDTVGNMIDLRYDLTEFVSLFYNNTSVEQKNISGDTSGFAAGSLTDTKRRIYGSELRWKWFDFLTEWEKDSSDVNPYKATRVRGNFSISPTRASSLTLSANRSKIRYQDERGTEKFTSAYLNFNSSVARYMNAEVRVEFMKDDGYYYDEKAWKYSFDLHSRFRLLDLEFKTEYVDRQETWKDREALRLEFRVIRYFSIL